VFDRGKVQEKLLKPVGGVGLAASQLHDAAAPVQLAA